MVGWLAGRVISNQPIITYRSCRESFALTKKQRDGGAAAAWMLTDCLLEWIWRRTTLRETEREKSIEFQFSIFHENLPHAPPIAIYGRAIMQATCFKLLSYIPQDW